MSAMTIPDSAYKEAAAAIAAIRQRSDKSASAIDIEKVLRAYVALGSSGSIYDWSYTLSDADKGNIADKVTAKAYSMFGIRAASSKVYVDLEIMETLAANGELQMNIARPREWQSRLDQQIKAAPDITSIQANVKKVFGDIIPDTKTLLLIGGAVALVLILTRK